MNPALLVIDLQRWFLEVGTAEKLAGVPTLIARCNELMDFFRGKRLPIVHVLTVHKADGSTRDLWMKRHDRSAMVEGTTDAEEHPEVHTFDTDVVITKTRHSAFIRTELECILRKMHVDSVVLVGFSTNACVGLTAIEAYERDFDVILAQDAILGCDQCRGESMLRVLHNEFAFDPLPSRKIMEEISAKATTRA
jgi:nicotinamidase-related amidase